MEIRTRASVNQSSRPKLSSRRYTSVASTDPRRRETDGGAQAFEPAPVVGGPNRRTACVSVSAIQKLPSGAAVRPTSPFAARTGQVATLPSAATRPMHSSASNHTAPSFPAVRSYGLRPVASGYSDMAPFVEIRPIACSSCSVNQSAPSGPAAIRVASRPGGSGQASYRPDVVMRPIAFLRPDPLSVNHSAPSGPNVRLSIESTLRRAWIRKRVRSPLCETWPRRSGSKVANHAEPSGAVVRAVIQFTSQSRSSPDESMRPRAWSDVNQIAPSVPAATSVAQSP